MAWTYFIAHAGADTEPARALYDMLSAQVPTFLDVACLAPGLPWDAGLAAAQVDACATVALISPQFDAAFYLREELARAIQLARLPGQSHRLVPVFIHGIPSDPRAVPYGLAILHALDWAALGVGGVAERLLALASALPPGTAPPGWTPAHPQASRKQLHTCLCRLLPAMYDELVELELDAPIHDFAPETAPRSRRALDLLNWATLQGKPTLTLLEGQLRRIAPGCFS